MAPLWVRVCVTVGILGSVCFVVLLGIVAFDPLGQPLPDWFIISSWVLTPSAIFAGFLPPYVYYREKERRLRREQAEHDLLLHDQMVAKQAVASYLQSLPQKIV